jgi:lysophospholipase L1-like esterase
MPNILAYGDSITWGSDPARPGVRHPFAVRWPEVLAAALGGSASIITDGLRGRTTAYDEHLAECDRNGARLLPSALYAHAPLDLVILMLGTNDLKPAIAGSAIAAMQGMRRLIEITLNHSPRLADVKKPRVLVVAPPHIIPTSDAVFTEMFAGAAAQSQRIAALYAALAQEMEVAFFDSAPIAHASPLDGVHLDAANTAAIGTALAPVVRSLLEGA